MDITLRELGPARIQVTVVVPDERVRVAEERALGTLGKDVAVKGFRAGKVPLPLLREHLSPRAVEEETIQVVVREVLPQALERSGLSPVIPPRVELRSHTPFTLAVTIVGRPAVTLDVAQLTKAVAGLPRGEATAQKGEDAAGQGESAILALIAAHVRADLAPELVDAEVRDLLETHERRLAEQGLSFPDWLEHMKKTSEQFLQDLRSPAEQRLRTRYGVTHLLEVLQVEVADDEVTAAASALLAALPEHERSVLAQFYTPGKKPYEQFRFQRRVQKLLARLEREATLVMPKT